VSTTTLCHEPGFDLVSMTFGCRLPEARSTAPPPRATAPLGGSFDARRRTMATCGPALCSVWDSSRSSPVTGALGGLQGPVVLRTLQVRPPRAAMAFRTAMKPASTVAGPARLAPRSTPATTGPRTASRPTSTAAASTATRAAPAEPAVRDPTARRGSVTTASVAPRCPVPTPPSAPARPTWTVAVSTASRVRRGGSVGSMATASRRRASTACAEIRPAPTRS